MEEKTKQCSRCKETYPLNKDYFTIDNSNKDGFYIFCKKCRYKWTEWKTKPIVKDGYKICNICNKELPNTTEYFSKCKGELLRSRCKQCINEGLRNKKPNEVIESNKLKQCKECKIYLPANLQYFHKSKTCTNGLRTICKSCRSKKAKEIINNIQYIMPETFICKKCNKELTLNEENFTINKSSKTGFAQICKSCRAKKDKTQGEHIDKPEYMECLGCSELLPFNNIYFYNFKKNKYGLRTKCKKCMKEDAELRAEKNDYIIKENKTCTKCNQILPINQFIKQKINRDGYSSWCKKCVNKYYYQTKDKVIEKTNERLDSKLNINSKIFATMSKYFNFIEDSFNKEEPYVKCYKCNKLFKPTVRECAIISQSFNSDNGILGFYCSTNCKENCSQYKVRIDKIVEAYNNGLSEHEIKKSNREISDKEIIKYALERDNYKCQKCGSIDNIHVHHIIPATQCNMFIHDLNNLICLCKDCHDKIHHQEGCKYHQLRLDYLKEIE